MPDPPNWETELRSLVVSDKLLQSDDIDAKVFTYLALRTLSRY